jgi:3',5'-cyclic AMP phosphodiesterase CpdA
MVRLAQLSDFHFTRLPRNPFRLFNKRLFGALNWALSRRQLFDHTPLLHLPSLFKELSVDWALLGGDLTSTALETEFAEGATFARSLNIPTLAIPGNHDHYTPRAFRTKRFYRFFSNPTPGGALTLASDRLEVHSLARGWSLIALDTAQPTGFNAADGLFSEQLEALLQSTLRALPPSEKIVLFNHYPLFLNYRPQLSLHRREALLALLLNEPRIKLYLHGHSHKQSIVDLQQNRLPIICDSGSCAMGGRAGWNLIDLEETGCRVTAYGWENGKWQPLRRELCPWKR